MGLMGGVASAQVSPADAQTDEDLRKRGKAAKHDKKHKKHDAHGIASLGTNISQTKHSKLHRPLADHAPAYKPKPHVLKRTHPAYSNSGTHIIGDVKNPAIAGQLAHAVPTIDFASIARIDPQGASAFIGPNNRRLTNIEVAQLFSEGVISASGNVASGSTSRARFLPFGMATPPLPAGATAPATASRQLSRTELVQQVLSNPDGYSPYVTQRALFGLLSGQRLTFKQLTQVLVNIEADGSVRQTGSGRDIELSLLQPGQPVSPPRLGIDQVPTPGQPIVPTPPQLGNNQVPSLNDLGNLAAAQPNELSPYVLAVALGRMPVGQRLTYEQAHGFRNLLAKDGSVLPQHSNTLRYDPQFSVIAPPQLGNNQIPTPSQSIVPTPPQLGNSAVPTPTRGPSRPPTLGQLTPPKPLIGPRPQTDFVALAAANPNGLSTYFTNTLTRYLTNHEVLGLAQADRIRADGSVDPSVGAVIEDRGPNYITPPTPPQLGNNAVPTPTRGGPRPPTLGQLTPPEPRIGPRPQTDFAALAAANPNGASIYYSRAGTRYFTNQEVLSLAKAGMLRIDGSVNPPAIALIEDRGPNYITPPTPTQLGNNQIPTPGQPIVPTPSRLGNDQVPSLNDLGNLAATQPNALSPYVLAMALGRMPAGQRLTYAQAHGFQNLLAKDGSVLPQHSNTLRYDPQFSVVAPPQLGIDQVPTPGQPIVPTPPQLANNAVPTPTRGPSRPPTLGQLTPPKPLIGPRPQTDFVALAAANPNGLSTYFTNTLTRYLTNHEVFGLAQAGRIRVDGSVDPSVGAVIEDRGPNYITLPTPPQLGNNETPVPGQPVTATPPQLGNNAVPTPGAPVTSTPPQLGNNAVPTPTRGDPRPPTLGQLTPPEPRIGPRPQTDFAALAAANPNGTSIYYSRAGTRYFTNQEVLSLAKAGMLRIDGSVNPTAIALIEDRGPNYITPPTPTQLGNNQIPNPGQPIVPTPPRLGNNAVPSPGQTVTATPQQLGNNETPVPGQPVTATPLQLGNNQVPSLNSQSALKAISVSAPNQLSSYVTASGTRLTNKQAYSLQQNGLIYSNGIPTSNAVGLFAGNEQKNVKLYNGQVPTINSTVSISADGNRSVNQEHRHSNNVVRDGKFNFTIFGVKQPDYERCPIAERDQKTLKCKTYPKTD